MKSNADTAEGKPEVLGNDGLKPLDKRVLPWLRFLKKPVVVIIGCMIGVILISYFFLLHQSLRLDESQSLWQSSHSIPGLLHAVALDVHVPLYHLMLHFWILYLGNGVATIRLLSLLLFLITIPVAYLLFREILSRKWALFAVILFSFSPFMDWYANEARMYTLLALMALLNQLFFMRIIRTGKGWFWFGLTAVIGAYSHYFFMFTLVSEGIFYLFNRRKFAPGTLKKLVIVGLVVTAALAPWLYYFHSLGSASGTRPLLAKPSTVDFSNVYSQLLFGFQNNHINTIVLSSWPILMLIVLLIVRRGIKASTQVSFIAVLAILPILLAYVGSLVTTPFFLSRYMISSVAPLILLVVWLVSKYARRATALVCGLLIIVTVLASIQQIASSATPVKENYKQAVDYINSHVQPQDLVVISAPFTIYPVEYYYRGSAQIDTLPDWDRSAVGAIPAFHKSTLAKQVQAQNQHHDDIYLLLSQNQGYENIIARYYLTHFKQISHKTYSNDLTLYVYRVGYYNVAPI